LHHEEFTQPRLLPNALVRSYIKLKMSRTISPITELKIESAGLLSVVLVVVEF
jgi:hypothetical protein